MSTKQVSSPVTRVRKNTRFVAINREDRTSIVAQGRNAVRVARSAESKGVPFFMSFVPKAGQTYVL